MCYIASTIAGYFIEKSNKEERPLSVFRLIKLVYIAHGWNLALYEKPLVSNRVEAWKYGPVMPSLHALFKSMDLKKDDLVKNFSMIEEMSEVSCIKGEHLELLNKVYVKYKKISEKRLTELMHADDTPWHLVWNDGKGRDKQITDDATKKYYSNKINKEKFKLLPVFSPIKTKKEANLFLKKAGILDDDGNLNPFYEN